MSLRLFVPLIQHFRQQYSKNSLSEDFVENTGTEMKEGEIILLNRTTSVSELFSILRVQKQKNGRVLYRDLGVSRLFLNGE